jgi:uncharacterized membrane protein (DUF106 family)
MVLEFLINIIQAYPKTSVIFVALAVTFLSMLITKYLTNQEKMRELKARQTACQKLMKDVKGDPAKMQKIQSDMMACSAEMMKMSFKPMLITFIPFLIIFAFLRGAFATSTIASSWFWYYLVVGIASSFLFRKLLKVA